MSSLEQRVPDCQPGRFVVRPACEGDLEAIQALVVEADGTLERFDDAGDASRAAIEATRASLAGRARPADQGYLLLIEDRATGCVEGCIGIGCRIGLEQPFYDYRLGKIVHSSKPLQTYRCHDVLYLCNDLTGCSELHSLYIGKRARKAGAAVQLVMAAQMFIASRPDEFAPRIIAELRGVEEPGCRSPFWEAVGRKFFRVDQRGAERLVAKGRKAFLAELMPKHPVYLGLLPESAQAAVGGVHRDLVPMAAMLEAEGFHFENHVDIFDGGRVMEAHTHRLNGVANPRPAVLRAGRPGGDAPVWWLASGAGAAFRMVLAQARDDEGRLAVAEDVLPSLGVEEGVAVQALVRR